MNRDLEKENNRNKFTRKYAAKISKEHPLKYKKEIVNEISDFFLFKSNKTVRLILQK